MSITTPADARRLLAEEIRVAAHIRSQRLVEALATVPREQFLPPGPWDIRGPDDTSGAARHTDDGDCTHVYRDVSIAIDPARHLFNGQPSLVARWLDELDLTTGHRVMHIGCGTGYFTAVMAHIVGPAGSIDAVEVDADLAARARISLADTSWVRVHHGNGATGLPASANAILVHAGASHILNAWLDALADGGRLLAPLTVEIPGMPVGISKGIALLVRRRGDQWEARVLAMPVAIYSLKDLRDVQRGATLAQAMMAGTLQKAARIRRDVHEPLPSCVVHGPDNCLST